MFTLENRELFRCTKRERASCMETVNTVVSLSETARKCGLLGFEDEGLKLNNEFQKSMIRNIVDGLDCESIRRLMEARIVASGATGAELLKLIIFGEGVLDILSGNNPRVTREYLEGFVGEDALEYWKKLEFLRRKNKSEKPGIDTIPEQTPITDESKESTNEITIKELAQLIRKADRSTQLSILEQLNDEGANNLADKIRKRLFLFDDILKLSNFVIESLLRNINLTDLAISLNIAPEEVKEKIFSQVSKRRRKMIEEDMEQLKTVSIREAEEAQIRICDALRKKKDEGKLYDWENIII